MNGARGVVKEFHDGLPVVRFRNSVEHVAKYERWAVKMADGRVIGNEDDFLNCIFKIVIGQHQFSHN